MQKLLIRFSALSITISYIIATSCHELQQSQLVSLNDRMNQMINTISSLLSKTSLKSSSSSSPTLGSQKDYIPNNSGYDTSYHSTPPAFTTLPPIPHVMFISPPYAPIAAAGGATSVISNAIIPPFSPFYASELGAQPDYISHVTPQSIWSKFSYDQYSPLQYAHPRSIPTPFPSYSPVPYPQPPYPIEYTLPYPSVSPPLTSTYPLNIAYPQSYPHFYAPSAPAVLMPPNSVPFAPPHPNYPELQSQYT